MSDLKISKVEVVAYDSNWPKYYEALAKGIRSALGKSCVSIHHVGSTSVPGLAAKPKLDIIAEVDDLNFSHHELEKQNYEYRGGFNIPFRNTFTRRGDGLDVNLHIFEKNDPEIELNLLFRDYLRNNPTARDEYESLKYKLLQNESSHQKDGAM